MHIAINKQHGRYAESLKQNCSSKMCCWMGKVSFQFLKEITWYGENSAKEIKIKKKKIEC